MSDEPAPVPSDTGDFDSVIDSDGWPEAATERLGSPGSGGSVTAGVGGSPPPDPDLDSTLESASAAPAIAAEAGEGPGVSPLPANTGVVGDAGGGAVCLEDLAQVLAAAAIAATAPAAVDAGAGLDVEALLSVEFMPVLSAPVVGKPATALLLEAAVAAPAPAAAAAVLVPPLAAAWLPLVPLLAAAPLAPPTTTAPP